MFWYNKTVVEFDLVQHQISLAWSSDVRLSFASPSITCHGKTNLMLDSVSSNKCLLLCIHVKETTKYSKSTDQISDGFWSVNETGFADFKVDRCNTSPRGQNSVDLQRIVTSFVQVNLLVKNFHLQVWLLR